MQPTLYMTNYLAGEEELLSSGGEAPLRLWSSFKEPLVELPYPWVRAPESLRLEPYMLGAWPEVCRQLWSKLDEIGVEKITEELKAISEERGGKPLVLVDYEDVVTNGDRSPRLIFSAWWEEQTGEPILELANDGSKLHLSDLPKRTRVMKPKDPTQDSRYHDEASLPSPLTHEAVAEWIQNRYWQQARTKTNPHAYTVKAWGSVENFERVVLFIREHGYHQTFGGDIYTQLDVRDHFYWTMGDALDSTVILNRKPLERDELPEPEELQSDREPVRTPPLFHLGEEAFRHVPVGSVLVPPSEVDWRILSAPGAMVATYYSPGGSSGCVAFVPASEMDWSEYPYVPELAKSSTTTDGRPHAGAADLRAQLRSCREGVAVGVRDAPRRE